MVCRHKQWFCKNTHNNFHVGKAPLSFFNTSQSHDFLSPLSHHFQALQLYCEHQVWYHCLMTAILSDGYGFSMFLCPILNWTAYKNFMYQVVLHLMQWICRGSHFIRSWRGQQSEGKTCLTCEAIECTPCKGKNF